LCIHNIYIIHITHMQKEKYTYVCLYMIYAITCKSYTFLGSGEMNLNKTPSTISIFFLNFFFSKNNFCLQCIIWWKHSRVQSSRLLEVACQPRFPSLKTTLLTECPSLGWGNTAMSSFAPGLHPLESRMPAEMELEANLYFPETCLAPTSK
jgi:hypothetical protein